MLHFVHISPNFLRWVTKVLTFHVSVKDSQLAMYIHMYICIATSNTITPILHDYNSLHHSNL